MTMIERNPVSHLLDGMVKCRHCGTPMATAGESFNEAPRYLCATRNEGCNTPEIEAEPFNRLVVRRAVHAFLSPQNTNKLLTLILDEAAKEEREDLRTVLAMKQQEQSPPEQDQTPRVALIGRVEPIPAEFADLPASLVSAGPASRKVEEYGLNPETYLRPSNLQTTKAIMDTLISQILVGPSSATIQYRLPVHPGGQQEPRTTEELPVR
jgi:hypothetical protein